MPENLNCFARAQTNMGSPHTLRFQSTHASPFVGMPLRVNEVGKITTLLLVSRTQFGITLSSCPQRMEIKLFPAVPMWKMRESNSFNILKEKISLVE